MTLSEFMEGRPHDKDVPLEVAVMRYIEQVEEVSIKNARELDGLMNAHQKLAKENDDMKTRSGGVNNDGIK